MRFMTAPRPRGEPTGQRRVGGERFPDSLGRRRASLSGRAPPRRYSSRTRPCGPGRRRRAMRIPQGGAARAAAAALALTVALAGRPASSQEAEEPLYTLIDLGAYAA